MLATSSKIFSNQTRRTAFDDLLFEICEELQLTKTKYELAEQRYKTIGNLLCAEGSPFVSADPKIYPQGSMRLGTTVKPLDGPFDLDFVCELSVNYLTQNPLELLNRLFTYFAGSDRYKGMVERKNRCVRIVYADDFYMDILPACKDHAACATCVQVPDRDDKCWKPSNPLAYAKWFEAKSQYRMYKFAEARDIHPLPALAATAQKEVLQLVVQLLKRWRDIFYNDSNFPPISIVLTTLAADLYDGEESTAEALLNILERAVERIDWLHAQNRRLSLPNPVHAGEDFSERWNNRNRAYEEFVIGIRKFATDWRKVCTSQDDPKPEFAKLFGGVVPTVLEKRAQRTQSLRKNQSLGVTASGVITSVNSAVVRMRPNTNFGNGEKI